MNVHCEKRRKHRKWGKISREKNIDPCGGCHPLSPLSSPIFYTFIQQQLVLFRSHTHKLEYSVCKFIFCSLTFLCPIIIYPDSLRILFCAHDEFETAFFINLFLWGVECPFLPSWVPTKKGAFHFWELRGVNGKFVA